MGILDSLSKNPSVIALAALGIGLFLFRDKISGFFSDISGGAAGIKSVTDLGFRASEGLNVQLDNLDNFFKGGEQFIQDSQTNIDSFFEGGQTFFDNIFKGITETVTDPFIPRETSTDITETPAAVGRASDRDRFTQTREEALREIQGLIPFPIVENRNIQTDVEGNFTGGGVSFIGGTVRETPITGESTLGFIIDKLGVSASKAADIRAGLQGFTAEEESFLGIGNNPSVSSGGFSGLTPQEIAQRLTGGIINNF